MKQLKAKLVARGKAKVKQTRLPQLFVGDKVRVSLLNLSKPDKGHRDPHAPYWSKTVYTVGRTAKTPREKYFLKSDPKKWYQRTQLQKVVPVDPSSVGRKNIIDDWVPPREGYRKSRRL